MLTLYFIVSAKNVVNPDYVSLQSGRPEPTRDLVAVQQRQHILAVRKNNACCLNDTFERRINRFLLVYLAVRFMRFYCELEMYACAQKLHAYFKVAPVHRQNNINMCSGMSEIRQTKCEHSQLIKSCPAAATRRNRTAKLANNTLCFEHNFSSVHFTVYTRTHNSLYATRFVIANQFPH